LAIANGGTGKTTASTAFNALSPITTAGDLIIGNGSNSATRLAIGTNGYVLTSNGTTASWAASAGGVTSFQTSLNGLTPNTSTTGAITLAGTLGATSGGTGFTTYAAGDLIYASATNTLSKLTAGTNGYVLTLASGVPTWAASTGGVTSFSAGSTGLTPSSATTGAITLAGTLAVANGGTGVTVSTGASSVALRDANANLTVNSIFEGFTSVAAAGTTTNLTAASAPTYLVTGSGGQTFQLPDATTLPAGAIFSFNNNQTSGTVVVKNNAGTTLVTLQAGAFVDVTLLVNSPAAGSWDTHAQAPSNVSWSTNTLDWAGSITNSTWNGATIAANHGGTAQSTYATGDILYASAANTLSKLAAGTNGYVLTLASGVPSWAAVSGTGTVTSVSQTFTGGIISVGGSPVTTSGTLALTVAGTSGGIPYFSSGTAWASSAVLAASAIVIGGGAGAAPATTATGTGVVTAIGNAVNAASGLMTGAGVATAGGIGYGNGTNHAYTAAGTAGQVVLSGGATTPTFTTGTLALAGNVTHSGAFTQTFTATANTSLTLPTSGYLISTVTNMAANPVTGTPSASTFLRGDGTWATPTGSGTVNSGTAGQMTYYASTGAAVSGNANATISSGALTLGVAGTAAGSLLLSGSTSGTVTVQSAAAAGTWSMTLPTTGGSSGQFLQTNGSGVTTWAAAGGGGSSTYTINNQTAAYTVVSGDLNAIINCSGATSFTVSLTAAATLGAGFNVWIWNNTTTTAMAVTIDPNGAETIDGVATLVLNRGEGTQIVCDGTNWQTGAKKTMRLYAENGTATSARPSATGAGCIAMGPAATSAGANSFASGNTASAAGTGSIALGSFTTANVTQSMAIGYSATSTAGGSIAIGLNTSATSANSTAIGLNSGATASTAITGAGATALGGSYASGQDSFAAAVANNTSTYGATAANAVAIGYQNKASATYSAAIGGRTSVAGVSYSLAFGYGGTPNSIGKTAFGAAVGVAGAQWGILSLYAATTGASATVLTSDGAAASTTNQLVLPDASAYTFSILVVARQQAVGGTASAAWKIEGLIRRETGVANTVLVSSNITTISNVPAWAIAVTADTTNGGLTVTATGAATTNIRWVATAQTSEVTYA
jgi:hypothetical protein